MGAIRTCFLLSLTACIFMSSIAKCVHKPEHSEECDEEPEVQARDLDEDCQHDRHHRRHSERSHHHRHHGEHHSSEHHSSEHHSSEHHSSEHHHNADCSMSISCKGHHTGGRIELPISGPVGPIGPTGFPGPMGPQGLDGPIGPTGAPGEPAEGACKVAFYVGLRTSKNFAGIDFHTPLLFDTVVTNLGEAYHNDTGEFVAPFSGVFSFVAHVAAMDKYKGAVDIQHNDQYIGTAWADSTDQWGSASNSFILALETGDRVQVVVRTQATGLYGNMYTSFSGLCLWKN